jgi:tetratricopeptide (TPR) repeat protein
MADFSRGSTAADVSSGWTVSSSQATVMTRTGEQLPSGFLGPVRGWASLQPTTRTALQLPRERARLGDVGAPGHDCIEITAWTESLGRIEDTLPTIAQRLAADGWLLLDVDNLQCARMLRMVVEGRPGQFDPAGSTTDPSLFLPLRRVLAAAAASGLWVHDVLRVPAPAQEFPPDFASTLFASGLLPLDWMHCTPPTRHWLVCRRQPLLAGSALIAGGDAAARERTAAALRAFLPANWEIVQSDAARECAQWNRCIAAARGEVIWFVRGGSLPTAELFFALAARALVGAVAPARDGEREHAGDVVGVMMPRLDALLVGPMPEYVQNSAVALEEHTMRIEATLPSVEPIEGEFTAPRPITEAPEAFAAESADLVQRWSLIQPRAARPPAERPAGTPAPAPRSSPWAGRAPRVTLCMIARNEERFLAECLTRARAAVDEIVLVDTGSTDRTVAIAESFGAKVLHSPWADDFSAPRNIGLRAATGDWILVLDADEFLQGDACERIRELVGSTTALGYHLRFINVYGNGKTLGVMMVRLFRNLPGVVYENVIHEQVTPSLQRLGTPLGLVLASGDVEVEHHGYSDAVMNERGKNERNERLFKKQLAQHPDDIYGLYKYGDFLRRVPGRGADAKRALDRCLELVLTGSPSLPRELPYASEVAALCALEAARTGDNDRARIVLDEALRRFVPTPNLHYLAASLALSEARCDDAIHHYRRCLAYRGQVLVVPIQDGITGYVSFAGIAQALMLRGDVERALPLLEQAIAIEPSYEVAQLALSRLWLQRGDVQRALGTLTAYLAAHPNSPGACQQITLILQRIGETAAAKRMGRHALQILEARAQDHEAATLRTALAAMEST